MAKHLVHYLAVALTWSIAFAQEEADITPLVAQHLQQYEVDLAKAKNDLQVLENRYLEELKKLKSEAEVAGNLDVALLVQDEIENFAIKKPRNFGSSPKLHQLRNIYQESAQRQEPIVIAKQKAVMKSFAIRFEEIKLTLTQQGNLKGAQQAEKFASHIKADLAGLGNKSKALWTLTSTRDVEIVKDCKLDRKGDQFLLSSPRKDGTYINTDKDFVPPIRIEARAGTDTTNVRFFFGNAAITFFNWEENPNHLRVMDPIRRVPRTFKNVGYLERNQLYDIVIEVSEKAITVHLDGEELATLKGDFSKASGPVGLGPALGSKITIERFEVFEMNESTTYLP